MASRRAFGPSAQRQLLALSCLVALSITAHAQEKPKDSVADEHLDEVIVTGSRIARPQLDRLQPTTVISSELFDERGYTDVGQALQELPAFGIQPSSAVNSQTGFGVAQSFVDLYSLGSQRTLTLVNGRRFVSSNTASLFDGATAPGQQVDLNAIPTKLIDRVETISVGGAPIYGADAIAGTVNIILKKDFEGFDLDAQTGVSNDKDAWSYRLHALAGKNFADGRGNITAVVEYSKSDGLVGTSRRNFSQDLSFLTPATPGKYDTVLTPNATIASVSTSGIPMLDDGLFAPGFGLDPSLLAITNSAGQPLAFSPGSSALKPYNLGVPTGDPIWWQGGDGARLSQFSNLLSPQERTNFDVLGNFKINDRVSAFAEGWFSETNSTNLLSQPGYSSALFGSGGLVNGNFLVSANNPFLSAADRATIQAQLAAYGANQPFGGFLDPNWDGNHFYVARANTDLQSGVATVNQVLSRGVLGLNGDFSVGEREYRWEVAAEYGFSRDMNYTPWYVFQNVQNALNATLNASGNIVCAGTPVNAPIATGSSTCAPLNIFGLGSPSAAARAYITHDAVAETYNTQRDITANLNGDVIRLPAGELKAAVGFEHRRESADFEPDAYYTENLGTSTASPVEGAYRTNEIYAETLIPIFEPSQGITALHQVELEGAARRVDNSIAGTATTWTAGLRWSPVEDVQFRGNKTKSIRAPAITELFLAPATSFETATDPCDMSSVGKGTAPATRAKNCAAAGIDTSTFVSSVQSATVRGLTSGNTHLQSETADSKTFGVVLRPHWVPRLELSVDYVEINLTNAIESLELTDVLAACYDSTNYPNDPSCSQFTRNAQGQVTSYQDGFVNAGSLDFQGITANLEWTAILPRSWGSLQWHANYLDTRKLRQQIASASPNNLVGELNQDLATPHSKAEFDVTYRRGPVSWFWQALYTGGFNFDNTDTLTSKDIPRVNPWWLINSTISYSVTKSFTARFIVNNVFDKEPPYPALDGVGGIFASATSLYFPGIIGRTYLLSLNLKF